MQHSHSNRKYIYFPTPILIKAYTIQNISKDYHYLILIKKYIISGSQKYIKSIYFNSLISLWLCREKKIES